MLDQLTSKQISEWEAYDKLDPVGTWREDFRLAYLSSLVTNISIKVHGKSGAKLTQPLDFMLEWGKEKEEIVQQSVEQMKEFMLNFARNQNRRVKLEVVNTRPPRKKKPPKRETK